MPRGDRTGPAGQGPRTGRGAGYCSGYEMPGYANAYGGPGLGRCMGRAWGRGWGLGMGRAWRRGRWAYSGWAGYGPGWYPPVAPIAPPPAYGAYAPWAPYEPSPDEELDALKQQAQMLKAELDAISGRIEELTCET